MAIQTIGGAAASTGVQGTPILKIQRATTTQAGVTFSDTEQLMEYTLSTPLPSGNYFFTFYSSSDYGGAQAILGLDNGTVLGSTISNGTTSTVATSVPAGRTLTKIWFRRNGTVTYSWSTNIELNAIVSTDTANFYGVRKTLASSPAYSVPPIPAGYIKVSNNNYLNAAQVSSDGTKTYFVVAGAGYSMSTSYPATTFGTYHNTNLNSILKFYEYDLVAGTLTEKAQPVFNTSTTCGLGWNPNSTPSNGSSWSAYLTHLTKSFCLVTPTYVYLDPGYASLAHYGSNNYTGEYPYAQMGRYNISTNTWTAVSSLRNQIQGVQPDYGAWTTTTLDALVFVPTFYYRSSYGTPDSINLYLYNWYSQYAMNYGYHYRPSTNSWSNTYNQNSTSSYSTPRSYGTSAPATDRYVFFSTDYNYYGPNSQNTIYIYDVEGSTTVSRYLSGLSSGVVAGFNGQDVAFSSYSFTTNAWFRHPTDPRKVYIAPYSSNVSEFYVLHVGSPSTSGGVVGSGTTTTTNIRDYLTRTKWKTNNPPQDGYGWLYNPAQDRLIFTQSGINPNTSTTLSAKLGPEVVPFPDALTSY
jgi:uncharacterized protein involved in tolerance to divalent cations